MLTRSDIAQQIVLISHRLYEKGFVSATDGNVSARLANGNILTTPTSMNKGRVGMSDLVEVTIEGRPVTLSRQASTELDMHLFIYLQRSDIQAVVHAHPVYATGFAAARIPLTECVFPEVVVGLGAIPLARYATPSTDEVADSLAPFVKHADAILLCNHGVVTYGKDLDDAYFKMEKVEHVAHMTFVARMLGGPRPLSGADVERLRAISQESYGKTISESNVCTTSDECRPEEGEEAMKQMIRELLNEKLSR